MSLPQSSDSEKNEPVTWPCSVWGCSAIEALREFQRVNYGKRLLIPKYNPNPYQKKIEMEDIEEVGHIMESNKDIERPGGADDRI